MIDARGQGTECFDIEKVERTGADMDFIPNQAVAQLSDSTWYTPYLGSATGGHKIASLVSLPAAEQGGASVFWKTYDSSLALSGV